jgi:Tol biopolymer transport system component
MCPGHTVRSILGTLPLLLVLATSGRAQPPRIDVGPGQVPANGLSLLPVVSFDGRYTAFVSFASNLVAGDANGHADVFRYDRTNGQLARGALAPALGAGEYPTLTALSHDGRWLLFNHLRGDWVAGDTNDATDAFLYDFATGAVERVSVATGGGQADGGSFATSMTPDARYVVFTSEASNLAPAGLDNGRLIDVFVRDRQTGTTIQVSRSHAGGPADGVSVNPQLSPDGAWVVFASLATNLTPTPVTGGRWRAYLTHWPTGRTVLMGDAAIDAAEAFFTGSATWNADGVGLA